MYFSNKDLLSPPVRRAAYSDRAAWIMAELSRLVYFKFEGEIQIKDMAKSLVGEDSQSKIEKVLNNVLNEKQKTADIAKQALESYLETAGFTLIETFNANGTQAFLVTSDTLKMNALVFRGTENDMRDIKADLKATTLEVDGNKVHSGFYHAFHEIKEDVEFALEELTNGYGLYITGHSLGGALALLATKYLVSDGIGACYTFGSPRVASSNFGDTIKTPIYRVVNAADIVPRMPPAYIVNILISVLEILPIPYLSKFLVKLFEQMLDYRHHGDMRYLTACKADYSDLRLIKNPTIIDRAIRMINRFISSGFKAGATDHFVKNYSDKLEHYADMRN